MDSWKNSNLLKKFNESLPVGERDDYAEWKDQYDYDNSIEGAHKNLQNRLGDFKAKNKVKKFNENLHKMFEVWDYYGQTNGYKWFEATKDENYAAPVFGFFSNLDEFLSEYFEELSRESDIFFTVDSKNLSREYESYGVLYNYDEDTPVKNIIGDVAMKDGQYGILILCEKTDFVSRREVLGLSEKICNVLYKKDRTCPIYGENFDDGWFGYFFDPKTDTVERAKKAIDMMNEVYYKK